MNSKKMNALAISALLLATMVMFSSCGKKAEWTKIEPTKLNDNPVELFEKDWMALAAGHKENLNAMTISWGSIGNLWQKPVVTVYVSPDRYTYEFMDNNDYFTVTAFSEEYREALNYLGTHSGRDGNKIKDAGLTVKFTELGNPAFEEGRLIIECKKIYKQQFNPANFTDNASNVYNSRIDVHHFYVGEIVNVWVK